VEASLELTGEVAAYIDAHPALELVMPPSLSVILWRRPGWQPSDYARMQDELLRRQLGFVTPTSWQGETVGRFAFVNPKTTMDMVRAMFDAVLELDERSRDV
jgi:glutamate/tyrosine decarboxylase-like PLP-dependent enzyme